MSDIVERLSVAWEKKPGAAMTKINRILIERRDAIAEITRLRQLLSEAEKREREARDREAELVGMIAAADESRLLQIRRADAARNVALDDAADVVALVSHEGLHNSMWRYRFESVAASIRSMKSEDS